MCANNPKWINIKSNGQISEKKFKNLGQDQNLKIPAILGSTGLRFPNFKTLLSKSLTGSFLMKNYASRENCDSS